VPTRLELHELPGAKRAGELSRLVEALYKQRRRVVVWVADEGRLQILDDYLWTFRRLSFVPHAVWTESIGDFDEPVALVSQAVNPNGAGILVVGDGLPPGDWAATFEEVHDLIPTGSDGEDRREHWEQWQRDQGLGGGEE
jgi:DNA polymerase-3 subunit chi